MDDKKKILVIDDEPDLLAALSQRLRSAGYEVVTASDGNEGLEQINSQLPDLIILDIVMPGMDGFELFKLIKKDASKTRIPVLILTARSAMEDTFHSLNANAFMSKPFDNQALLEKVEILLTKKALIYCDNANVSEKISAVFETIGYRADVIESEDIMVKKGKEYNYNVLVAYLPMVGKEPKEFLMLKNIFKNKDIKMLVYSDSLVKGTEDNRTLVIDEIRHKWERAGADAFFDPRTAFTSLADVVGSLGA